MRSSGRKATAIQQRGKASANSISRGRITRRQARSTAGKSPTDHGNHQAKCNAINCNRGTPLSLPGALGAVWRCPSHSTPTSWRRNPGKRHSVQMYHGATMSRKIDKYDQCKSRRKRKLASRYNNPRINSTAPG